MCSGETDAAVRIAKTKEQRKLAALVLAVRTRLELATSGVTGRHSNQLNYRTPFPR